MYISVGNHRLISASKSLALRSSNSWQGLKMGPGNELNGFRSNARQTDTSHFSHLYWIFFFFSRAPAFALGKIIIVAAKICQIDASLSQLSVNSFHLASKVKICAQGGWGWWGYMDRKKRRREESGKVTFFREKKGSFLRERKTWKISWFLLFLSYRGQILAP